MENPYTNGSRCTLGQRLTAEMQAIREDCSDLHRRITKLEDIMAPLMIDVATMKARIAAYAAVGAIAGAAVVEIVIRLIFI